MKSILLSLSLLLSFSLSAQESFNTSKGKVDIHPIVHGTLAIQHNDLNIFVDPYGGAEGFSAFGAPNLILITDIHGDHLNKSTLEGLDTKETTFIVPQAVANELGDITTGEIIILNNGETTNFKDIQIKALPMYNLPESEESRHTKGRGNGYILTIGDKTFYMSGDTEGIPEMRQLTGIDVAFVCMNLPYTMDVDQAASAVLDFKPGIVYPYHYRGKGGLSDVEKFKSLVNAGSEEIEVRLKNWYSQQ